MDQLTEGGGLVKMRWLLFIRAAFRRDELVEVEDVNLVPLSQYWPGDFVEEADCETFAEADSPVGPHVDVIQEDVDVVEQGLSCPPYGLRFVDGRWVLEE